MAYRLLAALVFLSALAGCGGGGGDATTEPAPTAPPATTATLSGVAATGAPFAGATITVYDAAGNAVTSTTAAADGSYTLEIPLTTPAPLVVEAVREQTLLVSTFAETRTTRLNITPLTNLLAARLAPDGDPQNLRGNAAAVTPEKLAAAVQELVAMLKPVLEAIGDSADPLTGSFAADGTGHDRVLDALSITIRPTGGSANIEVAVRSASAQPLTTSFNTDDATPPPPLPAVTVASLPPVGIAQMVEGLTTRMTACYAVPLPQRVSGATSTSTAVTGTASAVIAPECRTLFFGDDPATYLNNGARVGRDASNNGAFSGLFRAGATGAVFDSGQLEFLRDNPDKDIVFSYRVRDTAGGVSNDTLVARNVGGQLKLLGNQYQYNARVRAWIADREFLNQPAADFLSVGYNVWIANLVSGGLPVFEKVVVTTPSGNTVTYRPGAARSELLATRGDGTLTNSSVIVLAAKFKQASTAGHPSQYETGTSYAAPEYTEEQLRAIPEQGVWTLEFFHADTARPNVVQKYRTISRAPTLAEAALVPMADLTPAAKAEVRQDTAQYGVALFGPPSATSPNRADLSTAGGGDFWTVPAGAATPISVSVYGRGPDPDGSGPLRGTSFDDRVSVPASARKTLIECSKLSNADPHCDDSTGVMQFAEGSHISLMELFGVSPRGVEASKLPSFYYLLPR